MVLRLGWLPPDRGHAPHLAAAAGDPILQLAGHAARSLPRRSEGARRARKPVASSATAGPQDAPRPARNVGCALTQPPTSVGGPVAASTVKARKSARRRLTAYLRAADGPDVVRLKGLNWNDRRWAATVDAELQQLHLQYYDVQQHVWKETALALRIRHFYLRVPLHFVIQSNRHAIFNRADYAFAGETLYRPDPFLADFLSHWCN